MPLHVIDSVVSYSIGIVLDKVRNKAAEKLKQRGGVTHETLRNVIIEDLNDIKTKIDGLARKDLLASYSFLKEGVISLNVALDEAKDKQISDGKANAHQHGGSKPTETANRSESGVLNEAIELSTAIQKLNNTSNGRFVDAKECFKAAREEATRAFCNEALSLPDRIMATKFRIASKILECLHNTKVAAAGCMLFLEELHNLPGIGQTFSTYFKGGIKSIFYQVWRLENVKSVLSLNFAISEFIARFSGELPNVRNWPRIPLPTKGETIHPLVIDTQVVKEIFDTEEFQPPENQVTFNPKGWFVCAIDSKGHLLVKEGHGKINIINRSGNMKTFCELPQATTNLEGAQQDSQGIEALAIDCYDNVFIIMRYGNKCVLFVFDSTGNKKHKRALDFVDHERKLIKCAVNNDGEVLIHVIWENHLYVCDNTGTLKSRLPLEQNSSFDPELNFIYMQCVTNENEIIMRMGKNVLIYTREGKLKRTITVRNDVKKVTYNYQTSKIEILINKESTLGTTTSYSILSHSRNDEVECLYVPVKDWWMFYPFFSYHPVGPAALMVCQAYARKPGAIVFI